MRFIRSRIAVDCRRADRPASLGQAGLRDEIAVDRRRDQRPAVARCQPHQLRHVLAQELAAGIDAFAERVDRGFDAPADTASRFEHHEVDALRGKLARCGKAGEAGPDDDYPMPAADPRSIAGLDLLELGDHFELLLGRYRRLEQGLVDEFLDVGIALLLQHRGVDGAMPLPLAWP